MSRIDHNYILITGATGDIGGALAKACAAPGRRLILQGRNEPRLEAVRSECTALGAAVETKVLDVRDTMALIAWINDISARQTIDLALVNAGAINVLPPQNSFESWQEIESVLAVNVNAALATVAALLPHMQRRRSGQIALVSSLLAYFGMPTAPAYSASKAALKTYGDALRPRLARDGIRVNVVMPGFVRSTMCDKLTVRKAFMLSPEETAQRILRGLRANKAHVSFPWPLALGSWLLSVLPAALSQRIISALKYDRP